MGLRAWLTVNGMQWIYRKASWKFYWCGEGDRPRQRGDWMGRVYVHKGEDEHHQTHPKKEETKPGLIRIGVGHSLIWVVTRFVLCLWHYGARPKGTAKNGRPTERSLGMINSRMVFGWRPVRINPETQLTTPPPTPITESSGAATPLKPNKFPSHGGRCYFDAKKHSPQVRDNLPLWHQNYRAEIQLPHL